MTFYNIIFGILFLAACRQALLLFGTPLFVAAATIAIVVFNDSLNTSHIFERNKNPPDYRVWLKILDLFGFLTLALALIALKPSDNPFQFPPPDALTGFLDWATPWPFICAYWVIASIWNLIAKPYADSKCPVLLNGLSLFTLAPLFTMAVWIVFKKPPPAMLQIATLVFLTGYFLILKPVFEKSAAQRAAEQPTAEEMDAATATKKAADAAAAAAKATTSAQTAIDAAAASEAAAEKAGAENAAAQKAAAQAAVARAAAQNVPE